MEARIMARKRTRGSCPGDLIEQIKSDTWLLKQAIILQPLGKF